MASTQDLTRRIKSIKSTRKVTLAMQMVSASKMRKSQMQAVNSRTYAELTAELMASLPVADEITLPLLQQHPEAKKIAVFIVSTNKGLVGSFNMNLLSKLKELEQEHEGAQIELIVIGRKVSEAAGRMRKRLIANFPKSDGGESVAGVYPIAGQIEKMYETGEYRSVYMIYNHFVSTLSQKVVTKQLLPFTQPTDSAKHKGLSSPVDNTFEPSPTEVLNHLIPRIIESQLYQALLESDASEHSSRMVMMKNATESAGELIADLTLTFNQLRQGKITTELSEITAGKLALENT